MNVLKTVYIFTVHFKRSEEENMSSTSVGITAPDREVAKSYIEHWYAKNNPNWTIWVTYQKSQDIHADIHLETLVDLQKL